MVGAVEVTKDQILKLWLDWVEDSASWTESCGVMSCFFCGGLYLISGIDIDHKEDCVYKLTEEYIGE